MALGHWSFQSHADPKTKVGHMQGATVMVGFDPARAAVAMPECDRLVLPLTRLTIGILLLGAMIAGLLAR